MQSWLEIDLAAIAANAGRLASLAAPARLCAVVKANAYGHGLAAVSRALAGTAIEGLAFGVFALSEAVSLRDEGIADPVIVLGPVDAADLSEAARRKLEVALLAAGDARLFARHGVRAHVKVETGTRRFGMSGDEAMRVLNDVASTGLNLAGIYTHLANAEDLDREFTLQQLARLRAVADAANAAGVAHPGPTAPRPLLHMAASAAAMMWPETRLDMVRCGIALYGAWPSPEVHRFMARSAPEMTLTPALRWFAPIAQVKPVGAGEPVGYGCSFTPQRDSSIAVLGVGYADGLPRSAGNGRFSVRIGDARAPVVGRICMNACMVDVTGLSPTPAPGDAVEIDIEDLAEAAGTINYEILARLGAHLPRKYSA